MMHQCQSAACVFVNGSLSILSAHVLMTLNENLTSSEVVLSAQMANRRKYRSSDVAGIRYILASARISSYSFSLRKFSP